jgi:hypothetical protein
VSPLESLLSLRERVLMDIDRVMTDLVKQPAEHGANDLRAARLALLDLRDILLKRGEKEKGEDLLRAAQHITAELR